MNFEILEEAIYLAGLKDLNDPDEGRFVIKWNGSEEEITNYWRFTLRSEFPRASMAEIEAEALLRLRQVLDAGRAVPKEIVDSTRHVIEHVVRVACFTTHPTNYSMWANYAKHVDATGKMLDHGGLCIEYSCDERWRDTTLHPVAYSDDVPVVNPMDRDESSIARTVYMKSREWRGEDEWRVAYVLDSRPPFPENLTENSKIKLKGAVSAIIFGINTPRSTIDSIRERVAVVRPDISYKRVVKNPLTYVRELADCQ